MKAWFKNNLVLIGIIVFAALLRVYHIDFQSVWLDELHTLNETNPAFSFSQVYDEVISGEQMPPPYFLIMHVLFKWFGYTSIVLRSFSVITGVFGVVAMYVMGKEIHSKRAGLYAALLTTVNFFQIYYSQEGRPYVLLFLTTVFSFYFILRFIKSPSYKTAIVYALFAVMMIYSHFFALFALVAQAIILLYYIYRPFQVSSKKFFIYCCVSGLAIVLLYIPCLSILLTNVARTSFWIPPATLETYKNIFKDFFGHSGVIIYAMIIFIAAYYFILFKNKDVKEENNTQRNYRLGAFILTTWLVITIAIPAIRSYISVPMIISRYFINVLPIVLIMAAIVLDSIRNPIVRNTILAVIILFSLKNIIYDKKYYSTIAKSQFREVTDFINKRNEAKSPVVTTLYWHYKYFFNDIAQQQIIPGSLDDYIEHIKHDAKAIKPFWYTNAHGNQYSVKPENEIFLKEHFDLQDKIVLFDAWANHYVPRVNNYQIESISRGQPKVTVLNLEKFSPISSKSNSGLQFYNNGGSKSERIILKKGNYKRVISGESHPQKPLNNESAHFKLRINGDIAGDFYLGESGSSKKPTIPFKLQQDDNVIFELIFDNDALVGTMDRNGIITAIEIFEN